MQSLSSKLLEKAVEQFASLPGIGRKQLYVMCYICFAKALKK